MGIYVVMARDVSDALDMVNDTDDKDVLQILLDVLELPNSDEDNRELNSLFIEPVRRRLFSL